MAGNENTPRLGDGYIEIELEGGEKLTLKPTFGAAQAVSRLSGGIKGTMDKVLAVDMDAIYAVVCAGLGFIGNQRPPKDLQQKLWEAGMTDDTGGVVAQVAMFCRVLAGGGRLPKADESAEVEDRPQVRAHS